MELPESFTKKYRGRTVELIAIAKGRRCIVKLVDEWEEVSDVKPKWKASRGYVPLHLKNLRRGCKLFLEENFPGFKRPPQFLNKPTHIDQANTQLSHNAKTSQDHLHRRNGGSKER